MSTNTYLEFGADLNVADVDVVEGAAGPGLRVVVWLQGCLKRCPGCANDRYLATHAARRIAVSDVMHAIERLPACTGLTLSGGEPLLQAEPLIPLVQAVRDAGLTTVCYTGYTLEQLTSEVHTQFLRFIDLLIDGEYLQDMPRGGIYQPSSNQRLHFLSGRIQPEECADVTETVVRMSADAVAVTGTLPMAVRRRLSERLREQGIQAGFC